MELSLLLLLRILHPTSWIHIIFLEELLIPFCLCYSLLHTFRDCLSTALNPQWFLVGFEYSCICEHERGALLCEGSLPPVRPRVKDKKCGFPQAREGGWELDGSSTSSRWAFAKVAGWLGWDPAHRRAQACPRWLAQDRERQEIFIMLQYPKNVRGERNVDFWGGCPDSRWCHLGQTHSVNLFQSKDLCQNYALAYNIDQT